jgi:hypothetical protein
MLSVLAVAPAVRAGEASTGASAVPRLTLQTRALRVLTLGFGFRSRAILEYRRHADRSSALANQHQATGDHQMEQARPDLDAAERAYLGEVTERTHVLTAVSRTLGLLRRRGLRRLGGLHEREAETIERSASTALAGAHERLATVYERRADATGDHDQIVQTRQLAVDHVRHANRALDGANKSRREYDLHDHYDRLNSRARRASERLVQARLNKAQAHRSRAWAHATIAGMEWTEGRRENAIRLQELAVAEHELQLGEVEAADPRELHTQVAGVDAVGKSRASLERARAELERFRRETGRTRATR